MANSNFRWSLTYPCLFIRHAATAESTPPDTATATFLLLLGASVRANAEVAHNFLGLLAIKFWSMPHKSCCACWYSAQMLQFKHSAFQNCCSMRCLPALNDLREATSIERGYLRSCYDPLTFPWNTFFTIKSRFVSLIATGLWDPLYFL